MFVRTLALYKNSFTGLSPQTWLLSFIMLVNRSGTMVVPFMTLYLTNKEMNRSLSEAGLVMAMFGLGSIVGAYFGGKFSDRIGFFKVQLITLAGGGLLFLILGQLKSYPLICLFSFILAMVNEAFRPANSSAIAHYSKPENRTRSYSLNRLAVNLGWAVGSSLGGLIASYDYEMLFWVDGFTNIGAAILLFLFLKQPPQLQVQTKTNPSTPSSAYKDKTYLMFILLSTLFGMCFFQLFTTVPKYFRDNLGLTEDYIGFVMALNGVLIVTVEMVTVYLLEQKNRILFYISRGAFICSLAFFALLLPGPARYISLLMILIITVGEITAMPFMNSYWISRSNEQNRGQYAGLYTMAWGTGQTLGPYACALIADQAGFFVAFTTMGILLLLTAFGFSRLPS